MGAGGGVVAAADRIDHLPLLIEAQEAGLTSDRWSAGMYDLPHIYVGKIPRSGVPELELEEDDIEIAIAKGPVPDFDP